jgi:DNA polymerase III sliding clamp (beta) subunit (PCNA family)
MKIIAARRPFADAINRVAGATPLKPSRPILKSLYLSVTIDPDNPLASPTVVLTATDLELSISTAGDVRPARRQDGVDPVDIR